MHGKEAYDAVIWALEVFTLPLLYLQLIKPMFKGWISPHCTLLVVAGTWSSNKFQDSPEWYEDEKETGQAILDFCQSSGIPRSEIFYTTKLKFNNGYDHVRRAIAKSLED